MRECRSFSLVCALLCICIWGLGYVGDSLVRSVYCDAAKSQQYSNMYCDRAECPTIQFDGVF